MVFEKTQRNQNQSSKNPIKFWEQLKLFLEMYGFSDVVVKYGEIVDYFNSYDYFKN